MEQHLFILLIFTGVVPIVLSVTRNYYLVQEGRNWTDAQTYCQATHTDLAIIKSVEDVVQLQMEAQSKTFSSNAWIGMYSDINSWHWSLGYEPVGTMRKWDDGEPNNREGMQNCAVITPWGWWDLDCTEEHHFVCYDGTKTGSDSYIYISNKTQWYDAQAYCRQYHTDLASTRDENEYSIIDGLISGRTWFGMHKDPWKWIDHTNFSTISWVDGEPDNYMWNETCGYLDMGQAADAQCSEIMPFFCYSERTKKPYPTKQQTIRIKIQSNHDLNDNAANAAILGKIKQKLKDHGMEEDIMVQWRVNPDGVVFHKEKETKIA